MKISDILGMSLSNLWRRKMRTFLTVLGVIIGTASIVVMLSLGIGLKRAAMEQASSAGGLTEIYVSSDGEYGIESMLLGEDTLDKFLKLEHVTGVVPMINIAMPVQAGKYESYFEIIGIGQAGFEDMELGEGELPKKSGDALNLILGNQLIGDFYDSVTGEYPYWEKEELPDIDLMRTPIFIGIEKEENGLAEGVDGSEDSADLNGYYDPTFSESQDDFSGGDVGQDSAYEDGESDDFEEDSANDDLAEDDMSDDLWSEGSEWEEEDSVSYSAFSTDMKKVPIKVAGIIEGDINSDSKFSNAAYADIDALKAFLKQNYTQNEIIPGQPTDRNGKPYRDLKYTQMIVNVDEAQNVEAVLQKIQDMGFQADANKEWIEETEKTFMLIEAVLGGIGAVAMLVAAISIANTMTMSTYERTKEIGIMKVLGCNLSNIRSMFLSEAAFIGFIGGIAGVGFSFVLSLALNKFVAPMIMEEQLGLEANISAIPFWLVILAIIFATIIGMLAGFLPAQRATKLSPLAAIRNE